MFKLKGVIPPMITPFTEAGELDEQSLRQLVTYLNGKVDGLFICGSYGKKGREGKPSLPSLFASLRYFVEIIL